MKFVRALPLLLLLIAAPSFAKSPVKIVQDRSNLAIEFKKTFDAADSGGANWRLGQASKRLVDQVSFVPTVVLSKHFSLRAEYGILTAEPRDQVASVALRLRFFN